VSEDRLLADVRDLADRLGQLVYHTYDSRRSEPGYPDLTIIGRGVLFRELKVDGKYPTPAQRMYLESLRAAGADAEVWRPADWLSGRIAAQLRALGPAVVSEEARRAVIRAQAARTRRRLSARGLRIAPRVPAQARDTPDP
jgi:hypothetical protein